LKEKIKIQEKYLKGFVVRSGESIKTQRDIFTKKSTKLQVLKSKLPRDFNSLGAEPRISKDKYKDNISKIEELTLNTVKPTDSYDNLVDNSNKIKELTLLKNQDKINIDELFSRKSFQPSDKKLEKIKCELSSAIDIEEKNSLENLRKKSEIFAKKSAKNLEELYLLKLPLPKLTLNKLASDISEKLSKEDEARLIQLTEMHLTKSSNPSKLSKPAELNKPSQIAKLKSVIEKGLPDFTSLKLQSLKLTKLTKQTNQNKINNLTFNPKCSCCKTNEIAIKTFYDTESNHTKLIKINQIIASEKQATADFNRAENTLSNIEKYNAIAENNKLFDEMVNLEYRKAKSHNDSIDIKIATAKSHNDAIDNAKSTVESIDIYTASLRNASIDAEIATAKSHNKKISDAEAALMAIANRERWVALTNAQDENNLYIYSKIVEIESWVNAESEYWQRFDIKSEYDSNIILLAKYTENLCIKANLDAARAALSTAESELMRLTALKKSLFDRITLLTSNKDRLVELEVKSKVVANRAAFLQKYRKCVAKNGIAHDILTKVCNVLNLRCNAILKDIADFTLDISYIKNELKVYTAESDVKIPAAMASGYQKFVLDMIMRVVLTSSVFSSGVMTIANPNILIIDEGFGCLDKQNFIEVAKVLTKLKNNFHAMIIITHLDELKAYADHSLNISRVRMASILINGDFGAGAEGRFGLAEERNARQKELDAGRIVENERRLAAAGVKAAAKLAKAETRRAAAEAKALIKEAKAAAKRDMAAAKARSDVIVGDFTKLKQYIITAVYMEDAVPKYKCLACNKAYVHSDRKVVQHLTGSSYKSKHKKYVLKKLLE
jgi:DNA repair exonuclease SbcCD ATPase subunit